MTESLDLQSLTMLLVVGFMNSRVGPEGREPTEEESRNLGRLLTNIVNAAKGQKQIPGPEEVHEDDGEDVPEEDPEPDIPG